MRMMKLFFSAIVAMMALAVGCTRDINEDPGPMLCTIIYENTTEHDVQMEIFSYAGVDRETHKAIDLKKFFSLDIPAYSQVIKDMRTSELYSFYAVRILFDDGKVYSYEKEDVNEVIYDRSNPVNVASYSREIVEGIYKMTFKITDQLYEKAE